MSTQTAVTSSFLDEVVRRIVEAVRPEKVVLFGSRARGDSRPTSDIDILVIACSAEPRYRRSAPLYLALSDLYVPMDIVVYTRAEAEEWSEVPEALVTTALREGRVLYEKE